MIEDVKIMLYITHPLSLSLPPPLQQLTECTLRRVVADDPLAVADLRPEDIVG